MRCIACREPAGLLRRVCGPCAQVFALYEQHRGEVGLSQFLDVLIEAGVDRARIESALAADPDGQGVLRDRITADMANRLLADMGLPPRQTAADVRRLREGGGAGASTSRPAGDARPPKTR